MGPGVLILLSFLLACRGQIFFTEVMYNARLHDSLFEYLELYNSGASAVDISSWQIQGDVNYTFPAATSFAAGTWIVAAIDPTSLTLIYPAPAAQVYGPWNGSLANGGGTVNLLDNTGKLVTNFTRKTSYGELADGGGSSLELICYNFSSSGGIIQPWMWVASPLPTNPEPHSEYSGTPTKAPRWRSCLHQAYVQPLILITEVMYHTYGLTGYTDDGEFIELINNDTVTVDISNWRLTAQGGFTFTFPTGLQLAPGAMILIASNPTYLKAEYTIPGSVQVLGPWGQGGMGSNGWIVLVDTNGLTVDSLQYSNGDPFPWAPDAMGASNSSLPIDSPFMQYVVGQTPTGDPGYYVIKPQYVGNGQSLTRRSLAWGTDHGYNWMTANPNPGKAVYDTNLPLLPTISSVSVTSPASWYQILPGVPVTVTANLRPFDTPGSLAGFAWTVSTCTCTWFLDNIVTSTAGTQTNSACVFDGDSGWNFTIPAQAQNSIVRYKFTFKFSDGRSVTAPDLAYPFRYYSYFVDVPGSYSATFEQYHVFLDQQNWGNLINYIAPGRATVGGCGENLLWNQGVPTTVVYHGKVYDGDMRIQGSRWQRFNGDNVDINAWGGPGPLDSSGNPMSLVIYSYRFNLPGHESINGNNALIFHKTHQGCSFYQTPLTNRMGKLIGMPSAETSFARISMNGFFLRFMMVIQHGGSEWVKSAQKYIESKCLHQATELQFGDVFNSHGAPQEGPFLTGDFTTLSTFGCGYTLNDLYDHTYGRLSYKQQDYSLLEEMIANISGSSPSATMKTYLTNNFDLNQFFMYQAFFIDWAESWDQHYHNTIALCRISDRKWTFMPWDSDAMFGEAQSWNPGVSISNNQNRVLQVMNDNFFPQITQMVERLNAAFKTPTYSLQALLDQITLEFPVAEYSASDAWAPWSQNIPGCYNSLKNIFVSRRNWIDSNVGVYAGGTAKAVTDLQALFCPVKPTITPTFNVFTNVPGPTQAPELTWVNPSSVSIWFSQGNPQIATGAQTFKIQQSVNGAAWTTAASALTVGADYAVTFLAGSVPTGAMVTYRIISTNANGNSIPSLNATIFTPQNCTWNPWGPWSACPPTPACGGTTTQTRTQIAALNGGANCTGPSMNSTACPTPCPALPVIMNGNAGNCVINATNGSSCTPQCLPAFSGTLSATCGPDTCAWNVTGTCVPLTCNTPPTVSNASVAACVVPSTNGTSCTPVCDPGYMGTISTTCLYGNWSTNGTCNSTACAALPAVANSSAGSCVVNSPNGTNCVPVCNTGWTGTLTANCFNAVWGTTGSCVFTNCTTLPPATNSSAGDCTTPVFTGTSCAPVCDPGYTGTLSSKCTNTAWTTTGSCVFTNCTALPTIANSSAGNCSVPSFDGTSCVPVCDVGFAGTLSSKCSSTAWTSSGSCVFTNCTVLPPIANSSAGDCTLPAFNGSSCVPVCDSGFSGTLSANCLTTSWTTGGSCVFTNCTTLPTISNSTSGTCTVPAANGTSCVPVCDVGFAGTLNSNCLNAAWANTGSCVFTNCSSLPSILDSDPGNCTANSLDGTFCVPTCSNGYLGTLSATCKATVWTTTGTCASTACASPPAIANAGAGDCMSNSTNGTNCVPQCNADYVGTLTASCNDAVWSTTGSCTATNCTTLPVIANSVPGTCNSPSRNGTTCVPTCGPQYAGTLSATCLSASWTTTGVCTSTNCSSAVSIANAGPGTCVPNSLDTTTCVPACDATFVGVLSATCNAGTWSTNGTCTSTSCATPPFIPDADSTPCPSNALNGTSCVPTCNTGYVGTLAGHCLLGSWSLSGVCTSTACMTLPVFINAGPGDCVTNTSSGSSCSPACLPGSSGALTATCNNTAWENTGNCVPDPCGALPSITNATDGTCLTGATNGTTCVPVCDPGSAGSLLALCSWGNWTITGACGAVGGPQCTTLPSIPNAGPGNCTNPQDSGTTCYPVCNTGYAPNALSATCASASWALTGSCDPGACTALPVIGNATAGNCIAPALSGSSCVPTCATGFDGNLTASCSVGIWNTTGTCDQAPCTMPTTLPGNTTMGDCAAQASGTTCTPICSVGFFGAVTGTCFEGGWSWVGSCDDSTCLTNPTIANSLTGTCSFPEPNGTLCTPICDLDYFGNLTATCINSAWQTTGSCAPKIHCLSLPSGTNVEAGDCLNNTESGISCTPVCSPDFFGTLSATCLATGDWQVTGSCQSADCTTVPTTLTNAGVGNCISGSTNGTVCTPTCNAGWTGTLTATCVQTVWMTSGNCQQVQCSALPTLPVGSVIGNCTAPVFTGSACSPTCTAPLVGTIASTCTDFGNWTVVGTCALTTCKSLPPVPAHAGVGDCIANVGNGTNCVPLCNTGYTGQLAAVCGPTGTWSVIGTCTLTPTTPPSGPGTPPSGPGTPPSGPGTPPSGPGTPSGPYPPTPPPHPYKAKWPIIVGVLLPTCVLLLAGIGGFYVMGTPAAGFETV